MASNGKHMAKPNPNTNGKKIAASASLLAFLVTVSLGVNAITKNNGHNNDPETIAQIQTVSDYNIEELYNNMVSNNNIYQLNNNNYNTLGYIYQYFSLIINNPNMTEEEKINEINNLIQDENLLKNIYNYIQNSTNTATVYEQTPINYSNIEILLNNQEIMQQIKEASTTYRVPESILVGLIAKNISGPEITGEALFNLYSFGWDNLDSSRSSHNYITGNDDQLRGWNSGNSIMHLAAILENGIKEENTDLFHAIMIVLAGPNKMSSLDAEKDKEDKSDSYNEYAYKVNQILSYASAYLNDERFTLDYCSVIEDKTYTTTFESNEYYNYLEMMLNMVINELDAKVIQTYSSGIKLN